jgi:hypothetical protein
MCLKRIPSVHVVWAGWGVKGWGAVEGPLPSFAHPLVCPCSLAACLALLSVPHGVPQASTAGTASTACGTCCASSATSTTTIGAWCRTFFPLREHGCLSGCSLFLWVGGDKGIEEKEEMERRAQRPLVGGGGFVLCCRPGCPFAPTGCWQGASCGAAEEAGPAPRRLPALLCRKVGICWESGAQGSKDGGGAHSLLAAERLRQRCSSTLPVPARATPYLHLHCKLVHICKHHVRLPCCRYPGLLTTCFYFALKWCSHEPAFQVRRR